MKKNTRVARLKKVKLVQKFTKFSLALVLISGTLVFQTGHVLAMTNDNEMEAPSIQTTELLGDKEPAKGENILDSYLLDGTVVAQEFENAYHKFTWVTMYTNGERDYVNFDGKEYILTSTAATDEIGDNGYVTFHGVGFRTITGTNATGNKVSLEVDVREGKEPEVIPPDERLDFEVIAHDSDGHIIRGLGTYKAEAGTAYKFKAPLRLEGGWKVVKENHVFQIKEGVPRFGVEYVKEDEPAQKTEYKIKGETTAKVGERGKFTISKTVDGADVPVKIGDGYTLSVGGKAISGDSVLYEKAGKVIVTLQAKDKDEVLATVEVTVSEKSANPKPGEQATDSNQGGTKDKSKTPAVNTAAAKGKELPKTGESDVTFTTLLGIELMLLCSAAYLFRKWKLHSK